MFVCGKTTKLQAELTIFVMMRLFLDKKYYPLPLQSHSLVLFLFSFCRHDFSVCFSSPSWPLWIQSHSKFKQLSHCQNSLCFFSHFQRKIGKCGCSWMRLSDRWLRSHNGFVSYLYSRALDQARKSWKKQFEKCGLPVDIIPFLGNAMSWIMTKMWPWPLNATKQRW